MIYALMTFTAIMMALCYITYPNAKLVEKIAATIVMGICMGVISLAAYFIYLMIMALFVQMGVRAMVKDYRELKIRVSKQYCSEGFMSFLCPFFRMDYFLNKGPYCVLFNNALLEEDGKGNVLPCKKCMSLSKETECETP